MTNHLAAHLEFAAFVVREHPFGRRNNGYAQPVQDRTQFINPLVDPAAGFADALNVINHPLVIDRIFQVNLDSPLLLVFN